MTKKELESLARRINVQNYTVSFVKKVVNILLKDVSISDETFKNLQDAFKKEDNDIKELSNLYNEELVELNNTPKDDTVLN